MSVIDATVCVVFHQNKTAANTPFPYRELQMSVNLQGETTTCQRWDKWALILPFPRQKEDVL
jgi:hypothetical protein